MARPEVPIEQSLFPDLVPESVMGENDGQALDLRSLQLQESLAQLGINFTEGKSSPTHYGLVKVRAAGLLDQTSKEKARFSRLDRDGWVEYWRFHEPSDDSIETVDSYLESFMAININNKLELAIGTTPLITDMGIGDDHLILVRHIQSIGILAPWVTEVAIIAENIIAGAPKDYCPGVDEETALEWHEAFVESLNGSTGFKLFGHRKMALCRPGNSEQLTNQD